MLTRLRAKQARPISPDLSLSSASQPPAHASAVSSPVAAVASSSSDEYFSPPASPPPPARRRGRGRPPTGLGSRGLPAVNRILATGGNVQRIRWTTQMNENAMRAYFAATEGGINLTAYRTRILPLFQALEPNVNVSVQRLSDQVRAIQRCRLLDDAALERLRLDAQGNHISSTPSQSISTYPSATGTEQVSRSDEGEYDVATVVSTQTNVLLRSALEDALREFRYIQPELRPRLPRLPTHKKNIALVCALDSLLLNYFVNSKDLLDTHSILYCGAVAICRVAGIKLSKDYPTRPKSQAPAWQCRIEQRINEARVLIGKLYCFNSGNNRPRVMRFVRRAFLGTDIRPQEYITRVTERIDFFKQKICAWANRLRRYKRRVERYNQNRIFQSDQKCLYRSWEQTSQCVSDGLPPNDDAMCSFWHNIWSVPVTHTEGSWFCEVQQACNSIRNMSPVIIETTDVTNAVRSMSNWKSPGPDGLHNFWLKWLRSSHACLALQFQHSIESGLLPGFMTKGMTHLLHKSGSTSNPANYRPITCLPTIYKLLTSILRNKIKLHIIQNNIMSESQNGCKSGARGTKELLLIDMAICQQVRRSRRNLSTCWIDYKKAYDYVPHTWLMRVLELYKIDTTLCTFLKSCMRQWRTVLYNPACRRILGNGVPIRIERGIFQGDSLSPLWFCLALNPLSVLLGGSGLGYKLRRNGPVISHLLYMDDLKLFAPSNSQLSALLRVTENFSSSIRMEFGVDKCAVMHVKQGRVVESDGLQLSDSTQLRSLLAADTYKYLGMSQALVISETDMKRSLGERFFGRLKKVLKSFLSGGNKVRAFNGWVVPVLLYSFGILKWTQVELDAFDRRVRSLLTSFRMHHPLSSVMRLYIPRKCGGRGFLNTKTLHNREVCNLREYFLKSDVDMHRSVVAVDNGLTPLSLAKENWRRPVVLSISDRRDVWQRKELHGRFCRALHGSDVDLPSSVSWLRFGDLFGETEGFVCAIADEVIMTRDYRRHILRDGTVDVCRACHRPGESLRHIVSGCPRLANGEYLHRHNQVARIVHQQLALRYKLVVAEMPYYRYLPEPILENGHATLYWDRSIITDRTVICNKPDIVLIDRLERRAMIIDVTIPHDENLVKAEKDKQIKYLDLAHEIVDMWDVDSAVIVPIVVSVNGLIAKSLDHHLKRLALDSWVKGLMQKAVLLDTARIVRRFCLWSPNRRYLGSYSRCRQEENVNPVAGTSGITDTCNALPGENVDPSVINLDLPVTDDDDKNITADNSDSDSDNESDSDGCDSSQSEAEND